VLDARVSGAGIDGRAVTVATPFAPLPLQSARIALKGVDPQRFHAAAPKALLDIDLALEPSAAAGASGPAEWVVSGPLTLVNHAPGSYDSGALPVESLAAALRWADGELAASQLDLRLPGKGRASGDLRWRAPEAGSEGFGRIDGDLAVSGLDARRLDKRAVSTAIAGRLAATADAAGQRFSVDLRDPRLALRLKGRHADGELVLDEAYAAARQARLEARGKLALAGDGRFEASGSLSRFDPRAFVASAPPADLNARFSAAGRRAPELAALGHGLGGRLRLDGVLRGSPAQPNGEFELAGEKLRFGSLLLDALNGRGRVAEGRQGALSLKLDLEGLHSGDDEALVRRASLLIDGNRAANTTRLAVAGRGGATLAMNLAGTLSDGLRWDGQLAGLDVGGDYSVRLLAPVPLLLSPERVHLGRAELRGGGGGLYRFEETSWQARRLVARGSASGVQVGLILDPTTRAVKSRGDSLQIGGEWDVDIAEQVNGVVRFFREKGDLVLQGDSPVQLGLDELQLTLSAAANRLAFGFSAHGSRLGRASGAGTALAERGADGALRLVPGAPLLGSARIDIPSIAWAGPLADQNLKTDGSLKGEFTLAGTPARPEAAGRLRGERLSFVMADQGLHLAGGTLVADFNRDRLNLDELSFVSPNRVKPDEKRIDLARLTATPGTLTASGGVDLASGEGRFAFRAERLPLLQRSDQWLVLSGEGEVTSGWNFAHLKGRLAADAGFVGLSHTPAPSLGDDVVVQGPAKGGKPAASPFQMSTDLTINLGDALYVRALGLDTRLAGELSLFPRGPLAATGTSAPSAACMRAMGSGSASSAASSPSAARSPTRAST
jgi:translocation and assembly module TamB